jgi:hypothetical protein
VDSGCDKKIKDQTMSTPEPKENGKEEVEKLKPKSRGRQMGSSNMDSDDIDGMVLSSGYTIIRLRHMIYPVACDHSQSTGGGLISIISWLSAEMLDLIEQHAPVTLNDWKLLATEFNSRPKDGGLQRTPRKAETLRLK